ncbi:MAG: response regulator transcription factor [Anaerolineales bacterium]|nr:response regulator transcription factor [Anaerolineales bacterium]
MTGTLLLIEDDVRLCETLSQILTFKGFQVQTANDALTGLEKIYQDKPDLVILDIMLPDSDGWQVCSHIKAMSDVPVLILTALGAEEHVLKALELGADDYIVKPVTTQELLSRINSLLRRTYHRGKTLSADYAGSVLRYGDLMVDLDRHEVTLEGKRVDLSPTEFQLLTVLIRYEGRMLPHEFLLNKIWGSEYTNKIAYLRLYINYLRRKIEKDPEKPELIHNEWGIGYRFGAALPHRSDDAFPVLSGSQNINQPASSSKEPHFWTHPNQPNTDNTLRQPLLRPAFS